MNFSVSKPIDQLELVVVLIRSSTYDRDGYLIQWKKGSFPSNSLAVLYGLTNEAFTSPELKGLKSARVYAFDEVVRKDRINPEELMVRYSGPNRIVVVGFVGVQSSMLPRARYLAREFKKLGAQVVIGGVHVSGTITAQYDGIDSSAPCPHTMPSECEQLIDDGIIIFHGEAERLWPQTLADICRGKPQSMYRGGRPDITDAPLPQYPEGYFDGFFGRIGTFDTGRGCPFDCKYCCIHNVQGHDMRSRNVKAIVDHVRNAYHAGMRYWCFTDDNFSQNPYWEDLLLQLIALQCEGLKFSFMAQVDTTAWRKIGEKTKRRFVELLAHAGCSHVFIGIESVDQETLKQAGKPHNRVNTYQQMCEVYHRFAITCHASVMVGHPNDDSESIRDDVKTLQDDSFDQASFHIKTPLPGSHDHIEMLMSGVPIDADLNNYTAQQPVMDHPQMSRAELQKAYNDTWRQFYTKEQVIAAIMRIGARNYWYFLRNIFWYRWSIFCEKMHPMSAGFYRYKSWSDRRSDVVSPAYSRHIARELWRHLRYVGFFFREFYFFQHVYFQTHWLSRRRDTRTHLGDLRNSFAECRHTLYTRYHEICKRKVQRAPWFAKTFGRAANREWLSNFWCRYGSMKWKLLTHPHKWIWHIKMMLYAFVEACYTIRFSIVLLRALRRRGS